MTPAKFSTGKVQVNKTVAELREMGKAARNQVPFERLGEFTPTGRDSRVMMDRVRQLLIPELLPERTQRMGASAFSFFRGTAELMEADLAQQPNSGILTFTCGDAHIGNFGFYASPERRLLFDLNDFDEAGINPWEWDLKRLLVSVLLAAQANGVKDKKIRDFLPAVVASYRKSIKQMFELNTLNRFYPANDVEKIIQASALDEDSSKLLMNLINHANKHDSEQVVRKFTTLDVRGGLCFRENAPRTTHVDDDFTTHVADYFAAYRQTLRPDVNLLLSQYHITDVVRHSVGVGSFGSRCYLILLTSIDGSHLVLQVKEALPTRRRGSQQGTHITAEFEQTEGQRIVDSQKILQSASDVFLGYFAGNERSFYVRQFRDMKESVDLTQLDWDQFRTYANTCAWTLAMAHAASPTAGMIRGYVGNNGKTFDNQLATFAWLYADQVQTDYQEFCEYRLGATA
ncbi:hypothetical protein LZY01_06350 [Levilactobacillus zymae]|uniref:DUF2252 domain-containing protein n=1 Tax=Levilactobacillus zymae TaxID=267363 RepID=A0ABQ0WY28_9LACO|nr:DUF2252 domain-containing protein [Levilactobacillus zymae]KRL11200.1 hypothetical protein FD38_GL001712 [Levilactobacillus zymae DSM 19395]QFR60097.1 DUF2252 domain-containing protein [Levilactobacillus zymae]GEO71467.1 hypothetical protein LZY01_06350 [Levilactobacillus zymae]